MCVHIFMHVYVLSIHLLSQDAPSSFYIFPHPTPQSFIPIRNPHLLKNPIRDVNSSVPSLLSEQRSKYKHVNMCLHKHVSKYFNIK